MAGGEGALETATAEQRSTAGGDVAEARAIERLAERRGALRRARPLHKTTTGT